MYEENVVFELASDAEILAHKSRKKEEIEHNTRIELDKMMAEFRATYGITHVSPQKPPMNADSIQSSIIEDGQSILSDYPYVPYDRGPSLRRRIIKSVKRLFALGSGTN